MFIRLITSNKTPVLVAVDNIAHVMGTGTGSLVSTKLGSSLEVVQPPHTIEAKLTKLGVKLE